MLMGVAEFEKLASRTMPLQQWSKMKDAIEHIRTKVG